MNEMNMTKNGMVFVSGTFDENGGKRSKVMDDLFVGIMSHLKGRESNRVFYLNGGYLCDLDEAFNAVSDKKFVFWFANLDNNHEKMVKQIKKNYPKVMLVTSKRNFGEYEFQDVVAHGLRNKSNLIVEIGKQKAFDGDIFAARVLDPLGNIFCNFETDFYNVGKILANRAENLSNSTRMRSYCVGDALNVPDEKEFFELVKRSAEVFDELLPKPAYPARFLGNASFRCQRGFPSFRYNGMVFVSKRDVDKTFIGRDGFVAVEFNDCSVTYYGDHKPSVDTPIQLSLYEDYPKINYMIHGHVYISGAPMTEWNCPCGDLHEVDQVRRALEEHYQGTKTENFYLNLRGHGCLLGQSHVSRKDLELIKFISRPIPELIEEELLKSHGQQNLI